MSDIEYYEKEIQCEYKGETYLVRDNGKVKRLSKPGKKARALDDKWTFGTKGQNGYMTISSNRVHIIVATAFYGSRDSSKYVVDHKDTNRCNNRVENLRWLTKLENVLLNPITRRKIEFLCGSVEAFLKDPSILKNYSNLGKLEWMRTVSKEEAVNTLENLSKLQSSGANSHSSGFGEWIFASSVRKTDVLDQVYGIQKYSNIVPSEIITEQTKYNEENKITAKRNTKGQKLHEKLEKESIFVDGKIKIKAIKVRFIDIECYMCNSKYYVYLVTGAITDTGITLQNLEDIYDAEVVINEFDPIIISSVQKFLYQHPELNYSLGEIKERYSNQQDKSYMSFGCAKCDALFGDFYLREIENDYLYEKDDKNVHYIELDCDGLTVEEFKEPIDEIHYN